MVSAWFPYDPAWLTFAILFTALYVRMVRASVMETMNEDYVPDMLMPRARRAPRDAVAHPPQRDAARRDDPRDGHRSGARRRRVHGVCLRSARPRADGPSAVDTYDLPIVMGVVIFSTLTDHLLQPACRSALRVDRPRIRLSKEPVSLLQVEDIGRTSGRTTGSSKPSTRLASRSEKGERWASWASPAAGRA